MGVINRFKRAWNQLRGAGRYSKASSIGDFGNSNLTNEVTDNGSSDFRVEDDGRSVNSPDVAQQPIVAKNEGSEITPQIPQMPQPPNEIPDSPQQKTQAFQKTEKRSIKKPPKIRVSTRPYKPAQNFKDARDAETPSSEPEAAPNKNPLHTEVIPLDKSGPLSSIPEEGSEVIDSAVSSQPSSVSSSSENSPQGFNKPRQPSFDHDDGDVNRRGKPITTVQPKSSDSSQELSGAKKLDNRGAKNLYNYKGSSGIITDPTYSGDSGSPQGISEAGNGSSSRGSGSSETLPDPSKIRGPGGDNLASYSQDMAPPSSVSGGEESSLGLELNPETLSVSSDITSDSGFDAPLLDLRGRRPSPDSSAEKPFPEQKREAEDSLQKAGAKKPKLGDPLKDLATDAVNNTKLLSPEEKTKARENIEKTDFGRVHRVPPSGTDIAKANETLKSIEKKEKQALKILNKIKKQGYVHGLAASQKELEQVYNDETAATGIDFDPEQDSNKRVTKAGTTKEGNDWVKYVEKDKDGKSKDVRSRAKF